MKKTVDIVYATHRPETLHPTLSLMKEHEVIILEEPPHPDFGKLLEKRISIVDYMYDQDLEYPEFSQQQYGMLQRLHRQGKVIHQVEPYLDELIKIHFFFADGHSPDEVDRSTIGYEVYRRERDATRTLIEYYSKVRQDDFQAIVDSVKSFATTDAERFRLRDTMRAQEIVHLLEGYARFYVESGPMHILLTTFLQDELSSEWQINCVSVEQTILRKLDLEDIYYSPGDLLTFHYLLHQNNSSLYLDLLAARSLIYSKIVTKEEIVDGNDFPHLRDEYESIQLVNQLSYADCQNLFFTIRSCDTRSARIHVQNFFQ